MAAHVAAQKRREEEAQAEIARKEYAAKQAQIAADKALSEAIARKRDAEQAEREKAARLDLERKQV